MTKNDLQKNQSHFAAALVLLLLLAGGLSAKSQTSPPPSMGPLNLGLGKIRPVVAAGKNYILATSVAGEYYYFHRNPSDPIGTPDWKNPSTGTLATIFHDQILHINSPLSVDTETKNDGGELPKCTESGLGTGSYQDIGCTNAIYDGDAYYDQLSGHFFIMMKSRRNIAPCDDASDSPGTTGWASPADLVTPPKYVQISGSTYPVRKCHKSSANYTNEANARYIMVAVSRCNPHGTDCENPANGWRTYTLADLIGDWPQIMVTRGLVLINYRSWTKELMSDLWVFSAKALIDGVDALGHAVPEWMPAPLQSFDIGAQQGIDGSGKAVSITLANPILFVKQPRAGLYDFPFLFTYSGDHTQLWVYNLYPMNYPANPTNADLDLSRIGLLLGLSPARLVPLPKVNADVYVPAAYDNGYLYWASRAPGANNSADSMVRSFRLPLRSVAPNTLGQAPAVKLNIQDGYQEWDLIPSTSGTSYGYAVMNVVPSGNVLTMFHEWKSSTAGGKTTYQISPHYAVALAKSVNYESPQLISNPTGAASQPPGAAGDPDILSVASDPIYPGQLFMTSKSDDSTSWVTAAFTRNFSSMPKCNVALACAAADEDVFATCSDAQDHEFQQIDSSGNATNIETFTNATWDWNTYWPFQGPTLNFGSTGTYRVCAWDVANGLASPCQAPVTLTAQAASTCNPAPGGGLGSGPGGSQQAPPVQQCGKPGNYHACPQTKQ
jgi:hypothetical protein